MFKSDVVRRAKEFCLEHSIEEYPVRIVDLCKKMGISVFEEYLPEDVSGFIVIQEEPFHDYNSGKVIVVNLSDSAERRRFTIAHELAHYILHRDDNQSLYAHRDAGQNGGIEREANIFASNILMPEDLVRSFMDEMEDEAPGKLFDSYKVILLADQFAVSKPAAEVRLKELKLIG